MENETWCAEGLCETLCDGLIFAGHQRRGHDTTGGLGRNGRARQHGQRVVFSFLFEAGVNGFGNESFPGGESFGEVEQHVARLKMGENVLQHIKNDR